ncbi:MAG: PAS domain-containing protein [Candidatus Neomarinimicrobiota bacterium]
MSNRFRKRNTRDQDKTKVQLINELVALRQKIVKLEKSDAARHRETLALQEAYEHTQAIVNSVPEPLLVLDSDLRVTSANLSFYQTFHVTPAETEGQVFFKLWNHQWKNSQLRRLLRNTLSQNTTLHDFKVENDFPTLGRRIMLLSARRINHRTNNAKWIILAFEDITESKLAERAAQAKQEYATNRVESVHEPLVVLDANLRVVGGDN